MVFSSFAAAILFLLTSILLALYQSEKYGRVRLIDWSTLAMGGVYGGAWTLVMIYTLDGRNPAWEKWLVPSVDLYLIHTLCALIALLCAQIGWKVIGGAHEPRSARLDLDQRTYHRRLVVAGWGLLALAIFMQFFYTKALGGLWGVFEYANLMRAGVFAVENPLSFLQPFAGLALFASFVFLGLLMSGLRRINVVVGFLLSFTFSVYVLMSWQGRIGFLTYFATIIFSFFLKAGARPIVLIVGGGGLLAGMVFLAYELSSLLQIKASENFAFFIAKELSFPFGGFFAHLSAGENLTRGFKDFLFSPLYVLPSSWWVGLTETVGQVNTAVIMGAKKGDLGVTGAVPVDLLTLGLMQASVVGVAVVGFLFGGLLRAADYFLRTIQDAGVRAVLEAYLVIKIGVLAVFYAEPQLVVAGNFDLIICVVVLVLVRVFPSRG